MNNDEHQEDSKAAREGGIGADRMAAGLSCIPDKLRGDLAEIQRLRAELDAAKALIFKLKGEIGSVNSGTAKVVRFHRAEAKALRAELDALRAQPITHSAMVALEDCRRENARLGAACLLFKKACQSIVSPTRPRWRDTMEAAVSALKAYQDSTALAELLGPIEELLTEYPTAIHEFDSDYSRRVMEQLTLLRKLIRKD